MTFPPPTPAAAAEEAKTEAEAAAEAEAAEDDEEEEEDDDDAVASVAIASPPLLSDAGLEQTSSPSIHSFVKCKPLARKLPLAVFSTVRQNAREHVWKEEVDIGVERWITEK